MVLDALCGIIDMASKRCIRPLESRPVASMRAMVLKRTIALSETDAPLELVDLPVPQPKAGEIRSKVAACGVCHTELDEIEGRTPPPALPVVLGHEIVGRIDALGTAATRFAEGERVGVGWIHSSSGEVDENV